MRRFRDTRYAQASREIALAAGEPAGRARVSLQACSAIFRVCSNVLDPDVDGSRIDHGNLYAVLVDGDDHNDPIADSIRGTLDGHIVLDRAIAERGRFIRRSIFWRSLSRLADRAWTKDQKTVRDRGCVRWCFATKKRAICVRWAVVRREPTLRNSIRQLALVPKLNAVLTQGRSMIRPSREAFREIADAMQASAA